MKKETSAGGKKFKLNVIDIIVLALIAVLIVFFAVKFLVKAGYKPDNQEITYTVRVECMPKVMYDNISQYIPGTLVASGRLIDGEVISAEAFPCNPTVIGDYYYNEVEASQEYVTVIFTLRAEVDMKLLITEVGTQEVRPGRMHVVKTRLFEINGFIETVEWPEGANDMDKIIEK